MKKIFDQNRKLLIIATIPLLFTIIASLIKLPFDVVSPAYINEVDSVIEIDSKYEERGSFNTVSVYSFERVSLLHYLVALCDKKSTVSKTYRSYNLSNAEGYKAGVIQKNVSITNALIAGYSLAKDYGYDVMLDYHYEGYIVDTYYTYLTPDTLKIGDIITKVGSYELTKANEISSLVNKAEQESSSGIVLTVKRGNKVLDFTLTRNEYFDYYGEKRTGYGFAGYDYYVIDQAKPTYSLNKSDTIGPSGGLLQALMVFNALTADFDITSGQKIVGTGTIDNFGKIGEIGGIYQKIITADLTKADIFLVPVYRQSGYTEKYIKISKDNTWIIGSYDTKVQVAEETIPYLNSSNYWCIGNLMTNMKYTGMIITIPDEDNLANESNYLEAYRSYVNLKDSKMDFVAVATLEEAIVSLTKGTSFEKKIEENRSAYSLAKRNQNELTYADWISAIREVN